MDWVAIIIAIFGGGGLVALINAIKDWREGKAQREVDAQERVDLAEDRHLTRLEKRIVDQDERISALEAELRAERLYTASLVLALVQAGIECPPKASDSGGSLLN